MTKYIVKVRSCGEYYEGYSAGRTPYIGKAYRYTVEELKRILPDVKRTKMHLRLIPVEDKQ